MKIAVVGTGYVGLVTGTCFAETGNTVVCVDIDKAKIDRMRSGEVPIYEPGLEELFHRNIDEERLSFTTDLATAVADAEIIFLALPTPPNEDGSADLSYILGVANDLGKLLKNYSVIIDKSTVPVGTAERVRTAIAKTAQTEFDVASNPEFLREGFAVEDFMKPDRIVIGTTSERARKKLNELYAPFVRQGNPVFFMDERSAEMTKYAANAFLATKISFMNEVANLCDLTGADVDAVRLGIGADERIGKRFLFPGIGYGGSCFPKDVRALQKTAADHKYEFKILQSVTEVNERQKHLLFERVKKYYKGQLKGKRFALWGLAFKPDTDDIREAPALYLIDDLLAAGATVTAFDPQALDNVRKTHGQKAGLALVDHEYEALNDADALLIATEWPAFRVPDFARLKKELKKPVIFDGRNLYDPKDIQKHGFHYESMGRPALKGSKND
ncbi:MAG TPA: UDP-glucose/GDP-mannose dehydrogenase family protein [Candidatus Saccharimonadales bacterium]|nr:UDP-glucose/GDP-mannose dehydrogenase family protein [Candidatus Saccharimonadales bacterium]